MRWMIAVPDVVTRPISPTGSLAQIADVPALIGWFGHDPRTHRIETDVGRHCRRVHAVLHDHAVETPLPQGAAALMLPVVPERIAPAPALLEACQMPGNRVGLGRMKYKHFLMLLALIPGFSALSSCATTRGFGQDLQKVGERVERRAEATGAVN